MIRNILAFTLLLFLHNCASPGSAFLGPVITGAKTGSVYQASISYSSGQIMNVIKKSADDMFIKEKSKDSEINDDLSQPSVLVAILTPSIEIKDIFEEEPLP